MSFRLAFMFSYQGEVYADLIEYAGYSGPIPRVYELIYFSEKEREILKISQLPYGGWRVGQIVYDYGGDALIKATVSMFHNSEKRTHKKRVLKDSQTMKGTGDWLH